MRTKAHQTVPAGLREGIKAEDRKFTEKFLGPLLSSVDDGEIYIRAGRVETQWHV